MEETLNTHSLNPDAVDEVFTRRLPEWHRSIEEMIDIDPDKDGNTVDIANLERITIPLIRRIYPKLIVDIFTDAPFPLCESYRKGSSPPRIDWKKEGF